MKDRLYLLTPGFQMVDGGPFFCADCALVEGMLSFIPQLRDRVDVHYVNYERPRPKIVAELGPDHQSSPTLVLAGQPAADTQTKEANGKHFIDDAREICDYLARAHVVARPHF